MATEIDKGHSLWCVPFVMGWWHFHVVDRTLKIPPVLEHFLACWMWCLAICVWKSGWSGMEFYEYVGKAENHQYTIIRQRCCGMLTFWLCKLHEFIYVLARMCVYVSSSLGTMTGNRVLSCCVAAIDMVTLGCKGEKVWRLTSFSMGVRLLLFCLLLFCLLLFCLLLFCLLFLTVVSMRF